MDNFYIMICLNDTEFEKLRQENKFAKRQPDFVSALSGFFRKPETCAKIWSYSVSSSLLIDPIK